MSRPKAKFWCFTLNNHTDVDCFTSLPVGVTYLLYGREVGDSGTPHLQGFLALRLRQQISFVKRLFDRAHWEISRNVGASIEYCKKEGNYTELGAPPVVQPGKRNDLEAFKEAVTTGAVQSLDDVRTFHSSVYARYPNFCVEWLNQHRPVTEYIAVPLRPWQTELLSVVEGPVEPRIVRFYVDVKGGAGKTAFTKHVCSLSKERYFVVRAAKLADVAYLLAQCFPFPRCVIVDVSRCRSEFLQYGLLEELKDGCLTSTKYRPMRVEFDPPHVIVFMNECPDMTKLSDDRYVIIELN